MLRKYGQSAEDGTMPLAHCCFGEGHSNLCGYLCVGATYCCKYLTSYTPKAQLRNSSREPENDYCVCSFLECHPRFPHPVCIASVGGIVLLVPKGLGTEHWISKPEVRRFRFAVAGLCGRDSLCPNNSAAWCIFEYLPDHAVHQAWTKQFALSKIIKAFPAVSYSA